MKSVSRLWDGKREAALLAGVFVLVVLSRLPFHTQGVESFDAVNYMLAIEHFDMRLGQPQPPGYILYILIARAANALTGDPHRALLLVSQVFSGAAVVAMYLAGKEMFGRVVGAIAALLLATSPLFWYTGGVAVPYVPDLAIGTAVAWLAYRAMTSEPHGIPWAAAISLGLAGAFRLQTLMFLFPLFLFALRKHPWKHILTGTAVAGGIFAAFFLPSVYASGGIRAFFDALFAIVPALSANTSSTGYLQRVGDNAALTARHILGAIGELLLPLALGGLIALRENQSERQKERLRFLLLWVAPTWLVCLFIGPGNIGTIQVTTGPYYLLAACALTALIASFRFRRLGWALLTLVVLAHSILFTLLPYRPFGERYRAFYTYDTIRSTTANYQKKMDLIRAYPSDQTVVIAREFRLVQYYLPQFRVLSVPVFDPSQPEEMKSIIAVRHNRVEYLYDLHLRDVIPPGIRYVIFYDLHLVKVPINGAKLEPVGSGEAQIHVMLLPMNVQVDWTAAGLSTIPPTQ